MADITSSTYPVVTDSKEGDQYTIVRSGQLKKQTRAALDEHISGLQYSNFIGLNDTPNTYVGNQGKVPQVNSSQDGLDFVSSDLAPAFITLPDTPAAYGSPGYFLKVNATANGVEFTTASFSQLTDTPASFGGQAGKKVKVNIGETALEYVSDSFLSQSDTPSSYAGQALKVARVNAAETALELVDVEITQPTGWASYSDSQYTSGSPFVVSSGATVNLPNDAATVIDSFVPPGVTTLYDGTVITPENIGDAYEIRIDFKTSNNNVSGLADLILDIGAPQNEILRRTFSFPKGSGTTFDYSTTTAFYSLSTFVANGGTIKINSITGDTSIWDISYTIFRTHKGT